MKTRDALLGLSAFCIATAFGAWLGFASLSWGNGGRCRMPHKDFLTAAAILTQTTQDVNIPIVVYHSVRPYIAGESEYQDRYDVTPDLLSRQLAYLRDNGFTTITFKALANYFDKGTPLPKKPIILSFDDSWRNQYDYAYPVLKEFNVVGTFFVFTNSLDRGNHMTWVEVKEMKNSGMEIGSHTKTHPYLDDVTDPKTLEGEVGESRRILEGELGMTIDSFAYPFGEHASSTIAEVENSGYRIARSLRPGNIQKKSERYILPAFLTNDSLEDFKQKVNR